jgi:hypothetical protein
LLSKQQLPKPPAGKQQVRDEKSVRHAARSAAKTSRSIDEAGYREALVESLPMVIKITPETREKLISIAGKDEHARPKSKQRDPSHGGSSLADTGRDPGHANDTAGARPEVNRLTAARRCP